MSGIRSLKYAKKMKCYSLSDIKDVIQRLRNGDVTNHPHNELYELLSDQIYLDIEQKNSTSNSLQQASYVNRRMTDVIQYVIGLAQLDFSSKVEISENSDDFDALATAMNMLKEELQKSTVSSNFLSKIFNSMKEMVAVIDDTGKIKSVNSKWLNRLGLSEKEVIGKPLYSFVLPKENSVKIEDTHLIALLNEGREEMVALAAQEVIPVDVSVSDLDESHGMVVVMRDTSERIELINTQKKLLKDLKVRNEELLEITHILSHDIRTPIRGIATLADWLYKHNFDVINNEILESIRLMNQRAISLNDQVNAIHEYANIELGRHNTNKINTNELLHDITEYWSKRSVHKFIIKTTYPIINMAEVHFKLIVRNLILHTVQRNNQRKIEFVFDYSAENGFHQFYLHDNAEPLNELHKEKIFKLFYRMDFQDSISNITLPIVNKIIQYYGGTIWIEKAEHTGNVFFFTLPMELDLLDKAIGKE